MKIYYKGCDFTEQRTGDFLGTYTGGKFYPLDPRSADISLDDIAHSLSHICRFNGNTKFFYSVAQHSIAVCELLSSIDSPAQIQLYGLLHDGSEAYLCDLPRPVKQYMPEYVHIEEKVQNAIYAKFGLPAIHDSARSMVKLADDTALVHESVELMAGSEDWSFPPVPATLLSLLLPIKKESPKKIEEKFKKLCIELMGKIR